MMLASVKSGLLEAPLTTSFVTILSDDAGAGVSLISAVRARFGFADRQLVRPHQHELERATGEFNFGGAFAGVKRFAHFYTIAFESECRAVARHTRLHPRGDTREEIARHHAARTEHDLRAAVFHPAFQHISVTLSGLYCAKFAY